MIETDKIHLYESMRDVLTRSSKILHEVADCYGHCMPTQVASDVRDILHACFNALDPLNEVGGSVCDMLYGMLSRIYFFLCPIADACGQRITLDHTLRAREMANTCSLVLGDLEKAGELLR